MSDDFEHINESTVGDWENFAASVKERMKLARNALAVVGIGLTATAVAIESAGIAEASFAYADDTLQILGGAIVGFAVSRQFIAKQAERLEEKAVVDTLRLRDRSLLVHYARDLSNLGIR